MAANHKTGRERPDPTPLAITVPGMNREPDSLQAIIARAVRQEAFIRAADAAGHETFEEADDFDVDDDPELKSPYEVDEEVPPFRAKLDAPQIEEKVKKRWLPFLKAKKQAAEPPQAPLAGADDGGKKGE